MTVKIGRFFSFLLLACSTTMQANAQPAEGLWRGTIAMQGMELPFHFELKQEKGQTKAWLVNAEEKLLIRDAVISEDSVYFPMNLFDAYIKAAITGNSMEGIYVKNYSEDYRLPFKADCGLDYRFFPDSEQPAADFSGRWAINFASEEDSITSVGIFKQAGSRVSGTILTSTGDYRYLQGDVKGKTLYLSTFDGAHDFIFQASQLTPGKMVGLFLYGKHYKEGWTAVKDPKAEIPDPSRIVYAKSAVPFAFSLTSPDGGMLSQDDPALKNKPVILQIFGTWCSNSMDLTNFVDGWLAENPNSGFQWVGLSFETNGDPDYIKQRLAHWKTFINADVSLAFGGRAEKAEASKAFPTLSRVNAYPTLIILDREHKPVRTYGFFNGPATGDYYEAFREDFEAVVNTIMEQGRR